jgi:bacterioferritin-associated ferredoxin
MRLPHVTGDPIAFRFAGRRVVGHAGDSVAAALHDAGIKIWSRSHKFHRARGLSGTFVAGHAATVDGLPHVRLDRCAAEAGMRVDMQNVWPGPRLDLLRLARLMPRRWLKSGFEHSRLVPSGRWPFEAWESLLGFTAGEVDPPAIAGVLPAGRLIEADLAVVGGGMAGRDAANRAAANGASVVLIDRGPEPGATALAAGANLPPIDPRVTVLVGHEAFGLYDSGRHLACAPQDATAPAVVIRAGQVVLATGKRSVPPVVPGADLPGVLDAATALELAGRHAVAPGDVVAVIGTDRRDAVAARLGALGVRVVAVHHVRDVRRIIGWNEVSGLDIGHVVPCDAVVHAGPWRGDPLLAFQAGADGDLRVAAGALPDHVWLAGSAAEPDEPVSLGAKLDRRALVCPCMDVTVDEILDLAAGGETHVEVLKRLTGCGMGPCQGVPCWDQLAAVLAGATGQTPESFGHPTYRPPRAALTFGQAAGLEGLVPHP